MQPELAERILKTLSTQRFFDWYCAGGNFDRWISGEESPPTKEEILKDIENFFKLNQNE